MYVNLKIRSLEIIPGMGEGKITENYGEVDFTMIYLIYYKNFSKCHNIPPAQ
jgi:hypothetical protein